jgi:hypothetical protein
MKHRVELTNGRRKNADLPFTPDRAVVVAFLGEQRPAVEAALRAVGATGETVPALAQAVLGALDEAARRWR